MLKQLNQLVFKKITHGVIIQIEMYNFKSYVDIFKLQISTFFLKAKLRVYGSMCVSVTTKNRESTQTL